MTKIQEPRYERQGTRNNTQIENTKQYDFRLRQVSDEFAMARSGEGKRLEKEIWERMGDRDTAKVRE
jgi:hypothetical protein